jgi:hypothetical protein
VDIALISAAIVVGLFAAYNLFHYTLFLLVTHPRDAGNIGHALNEFEQRQLVEWTPKAEDFLKHDDENRTYDDVFGHYRGEHDNYSTCVFPRAAFTPPYDAECALLEPADGMRLLDLGCGSGAAADYLASRYSVEIVCVTNSAAYASSLPISTASTSRAKVSMRSMRSNPSATRKTWRLGWHAAGDRSSPEDAC